MKTPAIEILENALTTLKQSSKEEVKLRTMELGIVIPDEPKLSSLKGNSIFDFKGVFNEIIYTNKN